MKSKKSEIRITNNFNAPIGQHIDHVDTINFRMDGDGQFHFGMVETVSDEQTAQAAATAQESGASVQATVAGAGDDRLSDVAHCFRFPCEFTKQQVAEVLRTFYGGEHANLALIEVTLYDHGQLKKRNQHTAFVRSLVAWGLIDVDEAGVKQIVSGIKDKFRRLPVEGYQVWSDAYLNDKNFCKKISSRLDSTMKYQR